MLALSSVYEGVGAGSFLCEGGSSWENGFAVHFVIFYVLCASG